MGRLHITFSTREFSVQTAPDYSFYVSGVSSEMQTVQRLMGEIAPTDIPVLLVGESGTGKELIALRIHQLSGFRDLQFVKLSCAVFNMEALRSQLEELQSRAKQENEKGVGTLFFDEIGELDADSQRNLIGYLPGGGDISVNASVQSRFVSCTTRDLELEVQSGRFRADLFYRFNQICLRLPPLRNRKEDIPGLAHHFLQKYSRAFRRKEMNLSPKTVQTLMDYHWPGNIRELENVVKKIVALENEEFGIADLKMRSPVSPITSPTVLSRSLKAASRAASQLAERQLILQALEKTHWNRKRAAAELQISYKALLYKLKQIQLPDSDRFQEGTGKLP